MLLEDEGYLVKAVSSGNQALVAVRDFAADVLLLDINMPGMSGYEVARMLRERYGSAKPTLIAITARTSASDRSLANITGFDHHFGKPLDPKKLLDVLARMKAQSRPV
jgi:CheY-like chemotaxis protein